MSDCSHGRVGKGDSMGTSDRMPLGGGGLPPIAPEQAIFMASLLSRCEVRFAPGTAGRLEIQPTTGGFDAWPAYSTYYPAPSEPDVSGRRKGRGGKLA